MTDDARLIRYGACVVAILIGVLCAAAFTGTVGGVLATVFVGGGMLLFIRRLFIDLGWTADPPEPPTSGPAKPLSDHAGRPTSVPRRQLGSSRPKRMRGDRRRLR